ncbi:hypothetical protein JA1_003940 [Spathaspora sp. JA1]|nr:hypothetical protein JA1_003940 [Spathaspora sp. JA1]
MFRRRSRSTHNTAYTGVNQPAPPNHQPNSSAVAAALTIGNSLKTTAVKPITSLSQNNPKPQNQVKPPAPSKTYGGSLFKRGSRSSIGSIPSNVQPQPQHQPTQPNIQFRRFSSGSTITNTSSQSPGKTYDIDDSFTDSYIDDITDESTRVYLKNQQNLKDLKLEHKPATKTTVSAAKRTTSTATTKGTPKMVKKYIPTPTGIKIIEVPQETYDKEMARCNSMRGTGLSNSRSSSLRNIASHSIPRSSSLNNIPPRKPVVKRAVSAAAHPPATSAHNLESMKEIVELEDKLGKSDEIIEQQRRLELLQKQIDKEKELAHELEVKKKEYESLKAKRVEREKSFNKEIDRDSTFDNLEESTTIITPAEENGNGHNISDGIEKQEDHHITNEVEKQEQMYGQNLEKQEQYEHNTVTEKQENEYMADLIEKPVLSSVDTQNAAILPAVTISQSNDSTNFASLDPGVNELGIISQYGTFRSTELLTLEDHIKHDKHNDESSPASHPPSEQFTDSITVPTHHHGNASSKSSVYSNESPVRKPMKSAMKNSSSSLLPTQPQPPQQQHKAPITRKAPTKPNPAQQAYISLTTAENTRLNSKLSHAELNGASAYPQFHNPAPSPQVKRLSHQTLRKSPPPPQQIRTLRPNSMPMEPPGMTSRQFRHTPVQSSGHTVVQPVPPHPMTQPGYISPSKARAQELYAKAQARPKSVFKPTGKEAATAKSETVPPKDKSTKKKQRMTLRDPIPPTATQSHGSNPLDSSSETTPTSDNPSRRRKFKSRLLDSDDEDGPAGRYNGFSSRINDSDDEVHISRPVTVVKDVDVSPVGKEKKKFGKLRKLFGTKRGS